ncbi:MAG: leucine-rich repeat domain-containing protein [Treponema sp.]|nr:leucine-rich repeat domain-containing protein [Treponema sp.]
MKIASILYRGGRSAKFLNASRKALAVFTAVALAFSLASCGGSDSDDDSGDGGKKEQTQKTEPAADTAVYTAQPDDEPSCGAYSMAYYLVKTGQIKESEVKATADRLYSQIQFDDAVADGDYEFLEGYSDPVKILSVITPNYAKSAKLKMLTTPASEAELLLSGLAEGLGVTGIETISSFEEGFSDSDYCIEILQFDEASLHYVLTYKKEGVLFSRDPDDGKEYKRSEIRVAFPKYQFCNCGVFVTPYSEGENPGVISVKADEIATLEAKLTALKEAGFTAATVKITDMEDVEDPMDWTTLDKNNEELFFGTCMGYTDERFDEIFDAIIAVQGEITDVQDLETYRRIFSYTGLGVNLDLSGTELTYLPFCALADLEEFSSGSKNIKKPVNLINITLPDTLTAVLPYAFVYSGIMEITIPKAVTYIYAPFFATQGVSIIFESGSALTSLGSLGMEGDLKSVVIPKSVKTIEKGAFHKTLLESVTFEEGSELEEIGEEAFYGCSLSEILLPKSLKTIGKQAFDGNETLKSVTIPKTVTSIGIAAFLSCTALETITFTGTKEEWNAISKENAFLSDIPATVVNCSDGELALEKPWVG